MKPINIIASKRGAALSVNQGKGKPILDTAPKVGNLRWRICALLFFATTINYIDRQVLGILAPQLQAEMNWTEIQYGYIITAFQFAYALGFLVMGNIM